MAHLKTRNGAPLSTLTFGTMQFGGTADERESRAMYEAARAAGINHFDTAVGYTGGASERILGPMIAQDRDNIFLATKVGYKGGASSENILTQFDQSRRQLNQDAVDLLYLHRFDDNTPLAQTFETMAALQNSGKIRHIGVSNYAAWQVMKAQTIAKTFGTRIDAIQPMHSLVKRQAEVEIIPMATDQGISVFPYSPLGGGLLTGKYASGGTGRLTTDENYRMRYDQAWMHEAARGLSDLAKQIGTDPATLAVAWVMAHPAGLHPIISARSAAQLEPSLAAADFEMTDQLYQQISALSLTPPPATDRLEEA
ncbi:aldo/keto reductase [Loktanella sp. S4079]|uniref:aldo/keto reductase n=1 Tax=Loktanella sp. S4079 TaxID=579483 RepID=UPI0005FA7096|nr:aldo/keto reductase [Loktanella sp. S4079]KJZ20790.1 aldo/keto reductase [Loktanella sp. S4079]